jgi:hypothetical protein
MYPEPNRNYRRNDRHNEPPYRNDAPHFNDYDRHENPDFNRERRPYDLRERDRYPDYRTNNPRGREENNTPFYRDRPFYNEDDYRPYDRMREGHLYRERNREENPSYNDERETRYGRPENLDRHHNGRYYSPDFRERWEPEYYTRNRGRDERERDYHW